MAVKLELDGAQLSYRFTLRIVRPDGKATIGL